MYTAQEMISPCSHVTIQHGIVISITDDKKICSSADEVSIVSSTIGGITSLTCDVLDAEGCAGPKKLHIFRVLDNISPARRSYSFSPVPLHSTFINSRCHAELLISESES